LLTALDLAMMRRAIALGLRAAELDEVPVGAVIYRGRDIIAEGFNLRETTSDPVTHAELIAISRAGRRLGAWRLAGCSLAVTLEPCAMCAGAMVNARLDRVVYGADDPKAGAVRSLYEIADDARLNHRVEVIGGVLEKPCGMLLSAFFRRKREQRREARRQSMSRAMQHDATTEDRKRR
jgi:tRNA(adenine34) deaminase